MQNLPISHRSAAGEAAYQAAKLKRDKPVDLLSMPVIDQLGDWVIIENDFAYDMMYKVSHLAVFKGKADPVFLMQADWHDLLELFRKGGYHELKLNAPVKQSVNHVLHFHLLTLKDKRSEITI